MWLRFVMCTCKRILRDTGLDTTKIWPTTRCRKLRTSTTVFSHRIFFVTASLVYLGQISTSVVPRQNYREWDVVESGSNLLTGYACERPKCQLRLKLWTAMYQSWGRGTTYRKPEHPVCSPGAAEQFFTVPGSVGPDTFAPHHEERPW